MLVIPAMEESLKEEVYGPSQPGQKVRTCLKNDQSKKDWKEWLKQ
jgi:hypothetical protein